MLSKYKFITTGLAVFALVILAQGLGQFKVEQIVKSSDLALKIDLVKSVIFQLRQNEKDFFARNASKASKKQFILAAHSNDHCNGRDLLDCHEGITIDSSTQLYHYKLSIH